MSSKGKGMYRRGVLQEMILTVAWTLPRFTWREVILVAGGRSPKVVQSNLAAMERRGHLRKVSRGTSGRLGMAAVYELMLPVSCTVRA